jgi:hypothetical protein
MKVRRCQAQKFLTSWHQGHKVQNHVESKEPNNRTEKPFLFVSEDNDEQPFVKLPTPTTADSHVACTLTHTFKSRQNKVSAPWSWQELNARPFFAGFSRFVNHCDSHQRTEFRCHSETKSSALFLPFPILAEKHRHVVHVRTNLVVATVSVLQAYFSHSHLFLCGSQKQVTTSTFIGLKRR